MDLLRRCGNAKAAVLALLVVFAQLGGLLHELLEAHAVCPEHGEEVHAGGGPGTTAAHGRAGAPVLEHAPEGPGSPDHEHCSLPRQARELQQGSPAAPPPCVGLLATTRATPPAGVPLVGRRASAPLPARGPPVRI